MKSNIFPIAIVLCLLAPLISGCSSTAIQCAERGKVQVNRIERFVEPEVINKKNQLVIEELAKLSQSYTETYTMLDEEIGVNTYGNAKVVYDELIAQQKNLLPSAAKLQSLASDYNRKIHEQSLENMRATLLKLGEQIRKNQERADKVSSDQIAEVSKMLSELDALLRKSNRGD